MTAVPVPPLTDAEPPIGDGRLAEIRALFVTPEKPEHHDDWLARVCMQSDAAIELLTALDIAGEQLRAARAERARLADDVALLRQDYAAASMQRDQATAALTELAPASLDTENDRLRAERDQAQAELAKAQSGREAAKALIHPVLHGLDVRITNVPGDCHCNLIAEVILDAIYGRMDRPEEGADRV